MTALRIGVKVYDLDWFGQWGLEPAQLARLLENWGVDFVLTQSRRLPMADSAVRSSATAAQQRRLADYDERATRDALGEAGIGYWPTLCTYFEPEALAADPTLRPVGGDGRPMPLVDWYVGLLPGHAGWLERQCERVTQAVDELQPDGLFLSFCRWPGFWELWTPQHQRSETAEYSYDAASLQRFVGATGCALPTREPRAAAAWIDANAREAWARWKCGVIVEAVRALGDAARGAQPSAQVMLNTLPFAPSDWDNARAEVFGQDVTALAEVVDAFEVMTYHQILIRTVGWIGQRGSQVKAATGRPTYCTIQAAPLYLTGPHRRANRHERLDADEFARALVAARDAQVDGVIVFTLSDLLREALGQKDMRRIEALWAAKG